MQWFANHFQPYLTIDHSKDKIFDIMSQVNQKSIGELWPFRGHALKTDMTQEYYYETLPSVNTICHCIYKCNLGYCHAKKKPVTNNIQEHSRLLCARAHLRHVCYGPLGNRGKSRLLPQKPASVMLLGCLSVIGIAMLKSTYKFQSNICCQWRQRHF